MLHLPDGPAAGGVAVFGRLEPDGDDLDALCEALVTEGLAAFRVAYRRPATFETALADVAGAVRSLKAHPLVAERLAVVGHGTGAAVAAIAAGRDSRIAAAVLVDAPAEVADPRWRPMAELSRTRARVLLVGGDADRYGAVLMQARVRTDRLGGAEPEVSAKIAAWLRSTLG